MSDYYKMPDDTKSLIALAREVNPKKILLGEINPVALCRALAAHVEWLEEEVKRLKRI